jgi:hypothetical protein
MVRHSKTILLLSFFSVFQAKLLTIALCILHRPGQASFYRIRFLSQLAKPNHPPPHCLQFFFGRAKLV